MPAPCTCNTQLQLAAVQHRGAEAAHASTHACPVSAPTNAARKHTPTSLAAWHGLHPRFPAPCRSVLRSPLGGDPQRLVLGKGGQASGAQHGNVVLAPIDALRRGAQGVHKGCMGVQSVRGLARARGGAGGAGRRRQSKQGGGGAPVPVPATINAMHWPYGLWGGCSKRSGLAAGPLAHWLAGRGGRGGRQAGRQAGGQAGRTWKRPWFAATRNLVWGMRLASQWCPPAFSRYLREGGSGGRVPGGARGGCATRAAHRRGRQCQQGWLHGPTGCQVQQAARRLVRRGGGSTPGPWHLHSRYARRPFLPPRTRLLSCRQPARQSPPQLLAAL